MNGVAKRALVPVLVFALGAEASAEAAITKGPWVQRVTPTTAIVRVEVEPPGPVSVELGLGRAAADGGAPHTFESAEPRALHSIPLEGLSPSTRYTYTVRAQGQSKMGGLLTAPPEDSGAAFRFLVYGDNRSDDAAHAAVVRAMVPVASDFLVHTGDFVENGASPQQWQAFFDLEAPLMRERCLFSCVGNHELVDGKGREYVKYFGPTDPPPGAAAPPHLDGTFRWSNARFFLLNGMVGYRSGADRAWLDEALRDADGEPGLVWRIVVLHHGPWSSGPHGDNRLLHEAGIPALLREHKIDLVLSGHDHLYERGAADGLAYIVTGGGGAPPYRVRSRSPHGRKLEATRHFVEASVSPAAIQIAAIRTDGSVIERCALRKESGWDCDGAAPSAPASAASSSGTPAGPAPSRCSCRAAGRGASPGASLVGGALALAMFVARRRRAILDPCARPSSRS